MSRFPVNLDVVTVQNFDAFLAKKFFVVSCLIRSSDPAPGVCSHTLRQTVPKAYLLSRPHGGRNNYIMITISHSQFFDPFHIDGCIYEHHHHPNEPHDIHHHTLPPPTFGSPNPFINHIGSPLAKRQASDPMQENK